jgi:hypothetical protein
MAIQVIPTSSDSAFYDQRTRLDGRDYTLRFAWNEREARWYLTLLDESEEPIIRSIKVLANWPLLKSHRHDPRTPAGELVACDLTGLDTPPAFDELGIGLRCELTYFDAEEIASFG